MGCPAGEVIQRHILYRAVRPRNVNRGRSIGFRVDLIDDEVPLIVIAVVDRNAANFYRDLLGVRGVSHGTAGADRAVRNEQCETDYSK